MEGDAILSVQIVEHREVAELRWDGATELIRVEGPETARKKQLEQLRCIQIIKSISNQRLFKRNISNQR